MAGLLATLLGVVETPTPAVVPDDDGFWYNGLSQGGRSHAGRHVTPDLSMHVSAVYAAVNLLSKTVGCLPLSMFRVDRDGQKFAAPDHPLNDVLEFQPNSWQSPYDFKAMMQMHLALRGNAYAEIIPGRRGAVHALEPIHPDLVRPEMLPDRTIRYTVTGFNGSVRRLVQSEMFHIRSAICPNGIEGVGPVTFAKETIGLALAAEEHGARVFNNGARPSGFISLTKPIREESLRRLKSGLHSEYETVARSNKTLILEDGATFTPISMTADEIQFLGTREFSVEEIGRWFGVPLVMLQSMTKNTSFGKGIEQVMLYWVRNNLMPLLKSWQDSISRDLIIVPKIYRAEFDISALQRGDSQAQSQFFEKLVNAGILSRNEARVALQYNAKPGADDLLIPPNTQVAGDPAEEPDDEPDDNPDD